MKKLLLILPFVLLAMAATAQTVPTAVKGNASLTNSLIVSAKNGTKLFTVQGYNAQTTVQHVQVHQTNTVPANAAVPVFSFPVPPTNYFTLDFGAYGADLDKITVCISTNSATLGLAISNAASIQAVIKL